jgi:hypothetical protein
MKTFILPLLLGFQLFATSTFASGSEAPPAHAAMERELMRQIDKYITYPLLDRHDMDGEVLISLVIDAKGQAEVIEAHATSVDLLEYVLRRLQKVDIGANPSGTWRTTYLHLTFGPEA